MTRFAKNLHPLEINHTTQNFKKKTKQKLTIHFFKGRSQIIFFTEQKYLCRKS